jgi:hypothetical protein
VDMSGNGRARRHFKDVHDNVHLAPS